MQLIARAVIRVFHAARSHWVDSRTAQIEESRLERANPGSRLAQRARRLGPTTFTAPYRSSAPAADG
jgi:hypothetical protein